MKRFQAGISVEECIHRIEQKFSLHAIDRIKLMALKYKVISSLCITTNGGFDVKTGEYYPEEREIDYKVKLKYKDVETGITGFLLLKGIKNEVESFSKISKARVSFKKQKLWKQRIEQLGRRRYLKNSML